MVDITEIVESHLFADLYCSVCSNLLSRAPVLIDVYGKNVCGRCESDVSAGLLLHNVYFETLAHQFQFPCRFNYGGCKVKKIFSKIKDHEETCPYQTIKCGVKTCQWSGIPTELIIHISKFHKELIIENSCLEKDVSEGAGYFILITEGFYFLISWSYCENKFKLKVKNVHLVDLDCDITFNYSVSTVDFKKIIKTSGSLKLNNSVMLILEDLDNEGLPTSTPLLFSIHTVLSIDAINKKSEALNKIMCPNCSYTMIPPVLQCPVGHFTCVDCSDTDYDYCKICDDDELSFTCIPELEIFSASLLYECKWKDCGEYFSIREIELHQRVCTKRAYICLHCPLWKGLLINIAAHVAACTSKDYICPMFTETEFTINASIIIDTKEYSLIAHRELFLLFFYHQRDGGIEVAVCNCGPPSLFGWYRYDVVLHHTEDLNFAFNKTYIIKSKSSNRYTLKIPASDVIRFGEHTFCNITVKINLLSGSEKTQNVTRHFRLFKGLGM